MNRKHLGGKKHFLLLALLWALCLPLFSSESVEITEEELNKLEMTLIEQDNLITQQELKLTMLDKQLKNLETTLTLNDKMLKSVSTSFTELEKETRQSNIKIGLEVGGITLAIALPIGIVLGLWAIK